MKHYNNGKKYENTCNQIPEFEFISVSNARWKEHLLWFALHKVVRSRAKATQTSHS